MVLAEYGLVLGLEGMLLFMGVRIVMRTVALVRRTLTNLMGSARRSHSIEDLIT